MIIVSQDKSVILNFDNTEAIAILNPLENNEGMFKVCAITPSDNEYTLGKYKTEERAKEVLKDLISRYEAIELKKIDTLEKEGYTLADYTPVYKMPKEE